MSKENDYKVLLTSSGTGSRLGKLVEEKNKALVRVAGKEVISYIVENYNPDVEIVVTLGYKAKGVREFLQQTYPGRNFTFVEVAKYQGKGTSLGFSMLEAENFLNCPFIFHCNDTIVLDDIPEPNVNWNGGSLGNNPKIYNSVHLSSFSVKENRMTAIRGKGAAEYDLFHIGLVGIQDFESFWDNLNRAYEANPNDSTLNDVVAINMMLEQGHIFIAKRFEHWYDTGNMASLRDSDKQIRLLKNKE